jgi:hypothetical protein
LDIFCGALKKYSKKSNTFDYYRVENGVTVQLPFFKPIKIVGGVRTEIYNK